MIIKKENKSIFISKLVIFSLVILASIYLRADISKANVVGNTGVGNSESARAILESNNFREIKRSKPILINGARSTSAPLTVSSLASPASSAPVSNLVTNSSVELLATPTSSLPIGWSKGGFGTNNRVLSLVTPGNTGSVAMKVQISSYTGGDAKWYFTDIAVVPGHVYSFSDYYMSNVKTVVDARYKMLDGSYKYKDIIFLTATDVGSSTTSLVYKQAATQFTIPANVVSLTIFHIINSVGYLVTDDYTLTDVTPPPVDVTNRILNPGFQLVGSSSLPASWGQGKWGVSSTTFTYPVTNIDQSSAVRVDMNNFVSGDAKWYFNPLVLAPGTYTYSDQYISNISSTVTIQYQYIDGSYSYKDLGDLTPSLLPANSSYDFYVSNTVANVTVFHLIQQNGYLILDNTALRLKAAPKGIFTTGAITFRFDDGWLSQYVNAAPKLDSAGFRGTFYIVSRVLSDYGFTDVMSKANVVDLYKRGHEIGAHTRTHPFLSTLTDLGQQDEINGSRQDLLALNVGSINSLAFPFGDYTATSIAVAKSAGFTNAAATLDGFVVPTSDKYQLERQIVNSITTVSQVKSWIDQAVLSKRWLILTFHEVDNNTNLYNMTPANFNSVVDYVVVKGIPVVTIQRGMQSM